MKIFFLSFLFLSSILYSQKLSGIIYEVTENGNNVPLPGVNIFWAGTQIGTSSDANGKFELIKIAGEIADLVVSHITFKADTLQIMKGEINVEIFLKENRSINEIEVTAKATALSINELETLYTQEINKNELSKAACCNLSESFETNPSVDVSYGDAVTGAKQIKLLGLAGKYSQLMTENIPNIRGLASSLGLYYIPGPWMNSIQVSKGTASVINGYEAISGQINIEFKKPDGNELFYADLYLNSILKTDFNSNAEFQVGDKLSSVLMVHGEYLGNEIDHNNDSFLDHPNVKQLNIINRWKLLNSGNWHAQLLINYIAEKRVGGQGGFSNTDNPGNLYLSEIETNRFQVWTKTAYIFGNLSEASMGFINMFTFHDQKSQFGIRNYDADEYSFYSNLIYESKIFNDKNKVNIGLSLDYDKFNESFDTEQIITEEIIPGAFLQYTFTGIEKISIIGGARIDFHNKYGAFFTPRFHLRYNPLDNTSFRFTVGKGFRTSKIFAENFSYLASSREFVVENNLQMEEALNIGINLTQYFYPFERELRIGLEYYRTDFTNKIVVDVDKNSREVNFYNLNGKSYSNNYQIEVGYELVTGLDLLTAFRYIDAKTTFNGKFDSDPLTKEYKGLFTLSYLTPLRLWQFDFTSQFNGPSRIPGTTLTKSSNSPSYTLLNAQIKRYFKGWELYFGAENITDYTQENPIISADDPFGPDFDSTIIWGPLLGRRFYAGLRFYIK